MGQGNMEDVQLEVTLKEAKGYIFYTYLKKEIDGYKLLTGDHYFRGRYNAIGRYIDFDIGLHPAFDPNDLRFN